MESFLISVISFIICIAILITVHEFGHFWVARKFNVKVLRFSIGFGKTLVRFRGKKDNTEFVLAALPLGGYVKMLGEGDEHVKPEELHRTFDHQNVYKRFAIVIAGPLVNFIFAVFAFFLMYLIGITGIKPIMGEMDKDSIAWQSGFRQGDQIIQIDGNDVVTFGSMYEELLPFFIDRENVSVLIHSGQHLKLNLSAIPKSIEASHLHQSIGFQLDLPKVEAVIGKVFPDTPAQQAGLQENDKIVSIDDKAVSDWMDLVSYVKQRPNKKMQIMLIRDNNEKIIDLISASDMRNGKQVGILGIANKYKAVFDDSMVVVNRYSVGGALIKGVEKTWSMSLLTLKVFGKMLIGEASLKNISGPITIAEVAGNSFKQGIEYFLRFLAIVSLSLGVINLLPIPILDGGHLMFYLVEMIKGNPVSEKVRDFSLKIGIAILAMLMSLAIYNDIYRLLS
ncbi:MAG: RIP metalloprotease RseP [Pseudomonadota bacterium]